MTKSAKEPKKQPAKKKAAPKKKEPVERIIEEEIVFSTKPKMKRHI